MKTIVALGSGTGSTIEFFCQKILDEKPNFSISALITNNPQSQLLQIAKNFKLPYHLIPYDKTNIKKWDKNMCETLNLYKPYLILLAGFLKKIGPLVLKQFPNQIINSHPSLLPDFGGAGMYGSKVHKAVIKAKKTKTGVSIHKVNKEYDEGSIIAQKDILIEKNETAIELEKKVKQIEKPFYFETVKNILNNKF